MTYEEILSHFDGVKRSGDDKAVAKCPAHADGDPSLSITRGDKGTVLYCHAACDTRDVCEAAKLSLTDLFTEPPRKSGNGRDRGRQQVPRVAAKPAAPAELKLYRPTRGDITYQHNDQNGKLVYEHVRLAGPEKKILPLSHDPDGRRVYGLQGIKQIPYHLDEAVKTARAGGTIYWAEGHKDCDNVRKLGVTASTSGGASSWKPEFAQWFKGAGSFVIFPDNDTPGHNHADTVAADIMALGIPVRIIHLPGLAEHGDITDWLEAGGTREKLYQMIEATEPLEVEVADLSSLPAIFSHLEAANRLRAKHGRDILHKKGHGWLHWKDKKWAQDEKVVERMLNGVAYDAKVEAVEKFKSRATEKDAEALVKFARMIENNAGTIGSLSKAKSLEGIDGNHVELDDHPWLLTTNNGTIDLRTGELLPHDRDHYITLACPHDFNPEAKCPAFLKYLDETFEHDTELIDYVQWLMAYFLTGARIHHIFIVAYGDTGGGKSTFVKAIRHMMGNDISHHLDAEALMLHKQAQHSTEQAALRGKRFVTATETAAGRRLNEALIKGISGDDPIRARFMHENSFEFEPQCKILLATNHRPHVRDDSGSMWRRIRLLPFTACFVGREDKFIDGKLAAEAEGILAWAVRRVPDVARAEPSLPERVRLANEAYKADFDTLAEFLDCECQNSIGKKVSKTALYKAYQAFCGGKCESSHEFNKRIKKMNYEECRLNTGHMAWRDLILLTNDSNDLREN